MTLNDLRGQKKICLTSDLERSINTLTNLQVTSYNSERDDPYPLRITYNMEVRCRYKMTLLYKCMVINVLRKFYVRLLNLELLHEVWVRMRLGLG